MTLLVPAAARPATVALSLSLSASETPDASPLHRAAVALSEALARGHSLDARTLRPAMEAAFGGSDAAGAWNWKLAYDAAEAAVVLFLRQFGRAMHARAASLPQMLERLAPLLPSQTRRSEESQALQQFSTPLPLGFVVATAAAMTPADIVLEPSAGTGLVAIFAELAGASPPTTQRNFPRRRAPPPIGALPSPTRLPGPSRPGAPAPRIRPALPAAVGVELEYETCDWTPAEGARITGALYEPYALQSISIQGAHVHPTRLVQSAAMASVAPPKPSYRPHLPPAMLKAGLLSGAQLESVIYAGEAHSTYLAGSWTVKATFDVVSAASDDAAGAVRFRRGWFLGDGTGAGKGRQVAGIILDNWLKGPLPVEIRQIDRGCKARLVGTRPGTAAGYTARPFSPRDADPP